jgi:hypothetical protein
MFSQQRIPNRQRARPSFSASLFNATGAAVSNDIVGVFAHSASMTNSAQKHVNGLVNGFANANTKPAPKQTSLERQRNLLIVRLQEGRRRLARGKKSMGWLVKGEIKATPQQLVVLENRARQAETVQVFNPLVREVNIALGYVVVAT